MPQETFPVSVDLDVVGEGGTYPPAFTSQGTPTFVELYLVDSFAGGTTYRMRQILLRFDTSSLPDDATITSASLGLHFSYKADANSASVRGEFFDWGTGTAADYTTNPGSGAFSATLASIAVGGSTRNNTFPLAGAATGINKGGFTELRIGLKATGTPSADNECGISALEATVNQEALLTVDYTTNTETLRPTAVSGLTNLTGAFTDIDQDPDGTITDAGLVGSDPSGLSGQTVGPISPNSEAAATGLTTLSNNANVFDGNTTTFATTAHGTQNQNYGRSFLFNTTALAGVPSNATITGVTVHANQNVSAANRADQFYRLDSADNTAITNEVQSDAGTTQAVANVALTGTMPTRAQLVSGACRIRVRTIRTASQACTYNLYELTMTVTYSLPGTTVNTSVVVAMDNPTEVLETAGTDDGEIRARFRKKGSGANPQGRLIVRNAANTWSDTVVADTAITESDADGQLVSGTFDQSLITDPTDVVVEFVGTGAAGGLAELVAVEWNATFTSVILAGKTAAVTYNVAALTGKTGQVRYDVYNRATQTRDLLYNVSSRATQTRDLLYNVSSRATQTRGLLYDVRALASKSAQVGYGVYNRASASRTILYDIAAQAGQAGKSAAIGFDAYALSGKQAQLRFDVYSRASASRTMLYNISGFASQSRLALYDVHGFASGIRQLRYDVYGLAGVHCRTLGDLSSLATTLDNVSSVTLDELCPGGVTYDIYARASTTRTILYDVLVQAGLAGKQAQLLYDVRALASKNGQLRYDIYNRATQARSVLYNVFGLASKTGQLRFDVYGRATQTRPFLYNISGLTSKTGQLRYDIASLTSKTGQLRFDIASLASKTGQLRYDIRAFASALRLIGYDVYATASRTGQIRFDIYVRAGAARVVRYDVGGLAGASRTALYNVLTSALLAGRLAVIRYDVFGRAAKTGTLLYDVYNRTTQSRSVLYNISTLAGNTRQVRYDIRALAGALRVLGYDVRAYATGTGQIRYDLYTRSGTTRVVRYDVGGLAGASRTALYNVLANALLAGRLAAIRYDVYGRASKTGQLRYDLYGRAGGSSEILFDARALISRQGGIRYDVYGRASKTGQLRYDLYGLAGQPRTLLYDVRSLVGAQRIFLYRVDQLGAELILVLEAEVVPAMELPGQIDVPLMHEGKIQVPTILEGDVIPD